MNQVFGYQVMSDEISSHEIAFKGTNPVFTDANYGQIKVFVKPRTHLQSYFSQKYSAYLYIWGIPVHSEIVTSEIPEWCLNVIAEKRYERFRELIGTFVLIIDEPREHRITFVTDILGIRPMFLSKKNGRILFGSDVWTIQSSGMIDGKIDYDSVSAWIAYGFNCTDGTLFSDLCRLPPGSVVILQDDEHTEIPYAEFESKSQAPDAEQVSEEIHHIVTSTLKTLLTAHHRVSLALSGGYDSRYLLALSSSIPKTSVECATVCFNEEEKIVAYKVAESLECPLKSYPFKCSIWDYYDQTYHFMADGFPITKSVPYRIAQDYPGIPMLNGFMGDVLIRGDSDKFRGKYESEWKDDLVEVLQQKHLKIKFFMFRKKIAKRIQMRSRIPMEKAVREGSKLGKVFGWQDFYYTHRFYISNNFLQHIDYAEALIPFYSWALLSYKMEHAYKVFNWDTYRRIFQKHYPELAKIPHSSDLPVNKIKFEVAQCTKQWAKQIIPVLCKKNSLSLLRKKRLSIPLNITSFAGLRRAEIAVFIFERLFLLEKKAMEAGLDFDWERI